MTKTLRGLIAPHDAALPAIGAPGREWMSFGALRDLSRAVEAELRARGIAASDRVAIVLPNGPEMATAFVTIAQAAATAPLNPAYRQEEYEFYLEDLKARALVVEEGYDGPALAAARKFGLGILRLRAGEGPAGAFTLHMEGDTRPAAPGTPGPDDVALILHTSGTTSRPKIVPLLQSNIAASADNIRRALDLTPADRCLNVMPLFHIHGLIAA
ncbi:MAG: AMP-binding protein, partial [Rhodobacteraceae bacterium]|nr:AMP-binding protein [Paracoccaceae bacterium]